MERLKFKAYENAAGQTEFLDYFDQCTMTEQQNICAVLQLVATLGLDVAFKMKWLDSLTTNFYVLHILQNQTQRSTIYFHVVNDRCLLTNGLTEPMALTSPTARKHALALRTEFFQRYRFDHGLD